MIGSRQSRAKCSRARQRTQRPSLMGPRIGLAPLDVAGSFALRLSLPRHLPGLERPFRRKLTAVGLNLPMPICLPQAGAPTVGAGERACC